MTGIQFMLQCIMDMTATTIYLRISYLSAKTFHSLGDAWIDWDSTMINCFTDFRDHPEVKQCQYLWITDLSCKLLWPMSSQPRRNSEALINGFIIRGFLQLKLWYILTNSYDGGNNSGDCTGARTKYFNNEQFYV